MIRAGIASLAIAGLGLAALAAGPAREVTIDMDGTAYAPPTVTVERGTKVTWVNKDPFPHTATAAGKFDSKVIAAGGKWSWTAKAAGKYDYICTLHPGMKGTLVVK